MIDALLSWQMLVLWALLAVSIYYYRQAPTIHALLAPVSFTASVALFNIWVFTDDLDFAFKVFNAGINGALVVYLTVAFFFLFKPPDRADIPAKLLWLVVLVAEGWGLIFNNIGCNLVLETATRSEVAEAWAAGASRYVCGREIGEWFEVVPLVIELGLIVWIVQRYAHVRHTLRKKAPDKGNSS